MKIFDYLKETKEELKYVSFPTNRQTLLYTILVIVISVITALVLGGTDIGLGKMLLLITNS